MNSIKDLLESGIGISEILKEYTKMYRIPSKYSEIPPRLVDIKNGDIIVFPSYGELHNYDRYLVIENHPNKSYVICYDIDNDSFKVISNENFKLYSVGHEPANDKTKDVVSKIRSEKSDVLDVVRNSPVLYMPKFPTDDID